MKNHAFFSKKTMPQTPKTMLNLIDFGSSPKKASDVKVIVGANHHGKIIATQVHDKKTFFENNTMPISAV